MPVNNLSQKSLCWQWRRLLSFEILEERWVPSQLDLGNSLLPRGENYLSEYGVVGQPVEESTSQVIVSGTAYTSGETENYGSTESREGPTSITSSEDHGNQPVSQTETEHQTYSMETNESGQISSSESQVQPVSEDAHTEDHTGEDTHVILSGSGQSEYREDDEVRIITGGTSTENQESEDQVIIPPGITHPPVVTPPTPNPVPSGQNPPPTTNPTNPVEYDSPEIENEVVEVKIIPSPVSSSLPSTAKAGVSSTQETAESTSPPGQVTVEKLNAAPPVNFSGVSLPSDDTKGSARNPVLAPVGQISPGEVPPETSPHFSSTLAALTRTALVETMSGDQATNGMFLPEGATGADGQAPRIYFAGLIQDLGRFSLDEVEAGLRHFLDGLEEGVDQMLPLAGNSGLAPWIAAAALSGLALEMIRRQLRQPVPELDRIALETIPSTGFRHRPTSKLS